MKKMYPFVGVWAVAAVVSRKRARTIAAILCSEVRLTDLRLHKRSQLRPTSLPVGKTRLLSRVVRGGSKSPFFGRCSVCRDSITFAINHSPFLIQTPLADVRACNRPAALHGSRFAPMCSAHLSPPCKANDALERCFRVPWPYHSHPH